VNSVVHDLATSFGLHLSYLIAFADQCTNQCCNHLYLNLINYEQDIYMYSHGATMGESMGELAMSFHYIRFVVQVLFLSLLFVIAKDSFFFTWGDELD